MNASYSSKVEPRNFSIAFEQMCFAAIASASSPDEILQQLILNCFVILPEDQFETFAQFKEALAVLFGIEFPLSQIQDALESLCEQNIVSKPLDTNYVVEPTARSDLEKRIEQAKELEERVQTEWFEELDAKLPGIDHQIAWKALRSYAAKVFREHGVQAAALLDHSIASSEEHRDSLANILNNTLQSEFGSDREVLESTRTAITIFFSDISTSPDRATYIAQLADGAFNYFSLAVDPQAAQRFREHLSPLTIFLDTNFLFSILELNSEPMNEVASELLRIIRKHEFPFSLCVHERTVRELQNTINFYGNRIRGRHWPQHLSRAAITSPYLSGIALQYHKRNAKKKLPVESFLKPLDYADVLLIQKGIRIVKHQANDKLFERADLFGEYQKYLEERNNAKLDSIIQHDTIILNVVYQQRSDAFSSLDAGAILLSHDYYLYGFDKERDKTNGYTTAVVLPSQLLQILRRFVPSSENFDISFAETFAIPEFRTVGSGASEASSKLLTMLAGYQDFPEETATRLLSNDLLIDGLKEAAKDDDLFKRRVDSAIARQNEALLEEKAALDQQLEQEKTEKAHTEQAKLESDADVARYQQQAKEAAAQAQKEKGTRSGGCRYTALML